MSYIVPQISTSQALAVVVASATFGTAMDAQDSERVFYEYVCTVASWVKQGTGATTASAASGSMFVPAGVRVMLDPRDGVNVAAIRSTVDGTATLTRLRFVR